MKKFYFLVIGILIALVLAGCATPEQSIQQVTITLTADHMAFGANTITVPPGAHVTLIFNNQDVGEPHNVALYETSAATGPIFVGTIITGVETITYEFNAPMRTGTYFFRCDVHPEMNGQFIVQIGSTGSASGVGSGY